MEILIFWLLFTLVTTVVAVSKGRSGFGWFLLSLPLGLFALIMVACMPAIPAAKTAKTAKTWYDQERAANRL